MEKNSDLRMGGLVPTDSIKEFKIDWDAIIKHRIAMGDMPISATYFNGEITHVTFLNKAQVKLLKEYQKQEVKL